MRMFGASLEQARADVARAIDLEESHGATGRELALALSREASQIATPNSSFLFGLLCRSNWQDRAAAAILLGLDSTSTEIAVHKCVELAFADETQEVRGFALLGVASISARPLVRQVVAQELRGLFDERSRSRGLDLGEGLATQWIENLSMHVRCERRRRWYKSFRADRFTRLAGSDAPELLRGQGSAGKYLAHPNRNLRIAALEVIAKAANMAAWDAIKVRELASVDPDLGVRIAAVGTYGAIYDGTSDPSVESFLASIVLDESAPVYVREIAYHGLYRVHGVPVADRPDTKAAIRRPSRPFQFPEDMDVAFVEHCLRGDD